MSKMLENARRAGLAQQEMWSKRQAEKKSKDRRRSRVHRRGKWR